MSFRMKVAVATGAVALAAAGNIASAAGPGNCIGEFFKYYKTKYSLLSRAAVKFCKTDRSLESAMAIGFPLTEKINKAITKFNSKMQDLAAVCDPDFPYEFDDERTPFAEGVHTQVLQDMAVACDGEDDPGIP